MKNHQKKLNIGVLFGGKSPEHDVSIITGQLIISALKNTPHLVIPIFINKRGLWFIDKKLGLLKTFLNPIVLREHLQKIKNYTLDINHSVHKQKLIFKGSGLFTQHPPYIDVAFPCFHGLNGEDGTIQGLFELLNIPYVGCNVAASAFAMDKIYTKLIYQSKNIPTSNFLYFSKDSWDTNKNKSLNKIKQTLTFPLVVKPATLGSSIGITKVKNSKELEEAIEVALHYDQRIIIENAIEPLIDLTCAVLGNAPKNLQTSLVQETSFKKELLSYEDKYLEDGGTQTGQAIKNINIPAKISPAITKKITEITKRVFQLFNCSGIARVDFLLNKKTQELFVNEINTLPGNFYYHLWEKSGINKEQLIQTLIDLALDKHQQKQKITYTFDSKILEIAKGVKMQGHE